MVEKYSQYNDSYCLLKISEGDEQSFDIIFHRYRDRLFTYLYKVTKSSETAEEIVLDVFLKLWNGREMVVEIKDLNAFLFRVAHNKAIDFFRAVKRNPQQQEEIWNSIEEAISTETADGKMLGADIERIVQLGIDQLSPQRRKVYYLRDYEGLSYDEISKRLNLSRNTVRNHLAASVQFIKDFLRSNDTYIFIIVVLLLNLKAK
jgi:RNA polymerase sigma-70 factor (ECF subfamily)